MGFRSHGRLRNVTRNSKLRGTNSLSDSCGIFRRLSIAFDGPEAPSLSEETRALCGSQGSILNVELPANKSCDRRNSQARTEKSPGTPPPPLHTKTWEICEFCRGKTSVARTAVNGSSRQKRLFTFDRRRLDNILYRRRCGKTRQTACLVGNEKYWREGLRAAQMNGQRVHKTTTLAFARLTGYLECTHGDISIGTAPMSDGDVVLRMQDTCADFHVTSPPSATLSGKRVQHTPDNQVVMPEVDAGQHLPTSTDCIPPTGFSRTAQQQSSAIVATT